MNNILIVAEGNGYLPLSIKENLQNASYHVTILPADTDAINDFKEPIGGVLIYADTALIEEQQALHFLKDRVIMDDIPLFIAGDHEELNAVKNIIPKDIIRREFLRPINVNSLATVIDTFVKQYSTQNKKKILVVDDSGSMLRSVKGWLEDRYNVSLANSGAMAIKYITLNRPDLILLDYEMPIVDGKQVLEMIRAEMEFAEIPVIFLTGKGDKDTIMKVKDLKPDGFLLKSMEPGQIIRAIDEFFEKRKGLL